MNKIELSLWIEANYPATATSIYLRKPMCGIGANDAHYMTTTTVDGVVLWDPSYRSWVNMLHRAYNPKFHEKQPTYSDVTVCKEWHSFSAFRAWWLDSYKEGWQIDKDMLSIGNREYAPDTCICIPSWLNNFTINSRASRGDLPIGVYLCKQTGRYHSQCSNPITGKLHHLGLFNTPEAAHGAWLNRKLELAAQLKHDIDAIDKRIYPNVITIIKAAV